MAFTLSCFADEIGDSLEQQLEVMGGCGIKFMELRSIGKKNVSAFSREQVKKIKNALSLAGVSVSAIGSPIGKVRIDDDFKAHREKFLQVLETAQELNTKYIRIFSFYPPAGETGEDDFFLAACERLEELAGIAKKHGAVLLHENEKGIFGDTADRCLRLMERLYSENLGFTFDPANFVQSGQRVMPAYGALKKYVKYIHIKDALFSDGSVTPAGYGDAEIEPLLKAAKADGYDGFLSLEPHLGDFAGFAGLERGKTENGSGSAESAEKLPEYNPGMDGAERFALACGSLKKILAKI